MNIKEQLWSRIEQFDLDDPTAAFTFTARLARENNWSTEFARRVVEEYKRFLFLCCISQTGVTPSDAVDQAWHLHLTFTRSYWTDLCRQTLDREIHHNPTKGGEYERHKFDDYYSHTRSLYQSTFKTEPPFDIWPDNEARFSDIDFQRVNLRTNWVLSKPKKLFKIGLRVTCLLLVLEIILSATIHSLLPFFCLVFFLVIFVVGVAWMGPGEVSNSNRSGAKEDGGGGDSGCGGGGCNGGGCGAGCGDGCAGCGGCGG